MLSNDFYIGTLRQGKYRRKGINGRDERIDESKQLVFENHHEPIIDYPTFAYVQEQMKKRTRSRRHWKAMRRRTRRCFWRCWRA